METCLATYLPNNWPDFAALVELALLKDVPCLKIAISKCLGIGIVAGSALVKMPQIYKIYAAGSVSGLSGVAINIEMVASTCNFFYYIGLGYAFSTWGENFFLFFQNIAIVLLYFHFSRGLASGGAAVAVAAYAALGSALYLKAVPDVTLPAALVDGLGLRSATLTSEALAGGLPIVLMLFSRLPQIVQNARQGHAGQLALATYLLNTLGGAARVFTTLQELDDRIALVGVLSAFVQNFILTAQILTLGSAPKSPAKKPARKPKKA